MPVSYDRVMDVRRGFARAVSQRWAEDGVVVPTNAKQKVFVTSAADNLDEPRGIEYHGTAITLTSRVSHDNVREDPTPLSLDVTKKKTLSSSLVTVLLCPTLMNMLVTSPFHQWMLDRSGQSLLKIHEQ